MPSNVLTAFRKSEIHKGHHHQGAVPVPARDPPAASAQSPLTRELPESLSHPPNRDEGSVRVQQLEDGFWVAAFDPAPSLSEHRLSLSLSVRQGGRERRCAGDVDHLLVPNL